MKVGSPIQGKVNVHHRYEWPLLGQFTIAGCDYVVTSARAAELAASVEVPVSRLSGERLPLKESLDPLSDRDPLGSYADDEPSDPRRPILVSIGPNWKVGKDTIQVYDRARLIDGAFALLAQSRTDCHALVVGVVKLPRNQEKDFRRRSPNSDRRARREVMTPITDRLVVDTPAPCRVRIVSEPFVIPTGRGYAPAIWVEHVGVRKYFICGAKSATEPLEVIRTTRGQLRGALIEIRRGDTSPTSVYLITEISAR
jgi:hypothetical protein